MEIRERGIDIFSHQGIVDFEKVKQAGYSFVIIKAGQGRTPMKTFQERYLPGVQKVGLDWGAYWWSDAVTSEEAKTKEQPEEQAPDDKALYLAEKEKIQRAMKILRG